MMTAEFEIDKEFLRNEEKSQKHKENSAWFFVILTYVQKENFKLQWYQTMETIEINIPMFTYFNIYATTNNIDYPFAEISMFQKEWDTTSKKKIVSPHPPLEEIIASPYKKTNPKDDESRNANLKDIKSSNNKIILQIIF